MQIAWKTLTKTTKPTKKRQTDTTRDNTFFWTAALPLILLAFETFSGDCMQIAWKTLTKTTKPTKKRQTDTTRDNTFFGQPHCR